MSAEGSPTPPERLSGLSDRLKERVGRPLFDADEESGVRALLRRGPLGAGVGNSAKTLLPRQLRMFPFTSPTWPGSVPREQDRSTLEVNYDTEWARDPWARAIRRALTEGLMRPGVGMLASPQVHGTDRIDGLVEAVPHVAAIERLVEAAAAVGGDQALRVVLVEHEREVERGTGW